MCSLPPWQIWVPIPSASNAALCFWLLYLEGTGVHGAHHVIYVDWEGRVLDNNLPLSRPTMSLDRIIDHLGARLATIANVWFMGVPPLELATSP